jgi:hypothetical protein
MKGFLFFTFISFSALSASVCEQPQSISSWFQSFTGFMQPKKCDYNNQNYPVVDDSAIRAERLSTKCAQKWVVTNSAGVKNHLPAGLRVMRLDQNNPSRIAYHSGGNIHEGVVDEIAFTGRKNCQQSQKPNFEAFLEESNFALELAAGLDLGNSAAFADEIKNLKIRLTKLNKNSFQELQLKWDSQFIEADPVNRLNHLQKMLSSSYDPPLSDQKKISETTLAVPLSQKWFQSHPELKAFYQKEWLESGKDIRISAGASGEGVSFYPNNPDASESFLEMNELLIKTEAFLKNSKDPKLKNSLEAKWLTNEKQKGFSNYQRMIFMSPETWERISPRNNWADYVPVDQSLGGLKTDYLLSVLIHELNVNSSGFLPQDTHIDYETSASLMECLKKEGVNQLASDPHTLQRAFGLNAQISVLYLKMVLDQLEGPK